jgi:multicomponent Na+:H+ antiporter subunit D
VAPLLGVIVLLQALSLAGIPPLSGFWGKYLLVLAGVQEGAWVLVSLALVASFLTLASMMKIWIGAFWREPEDVPAAVVDRPARAQQRAMLVLLVTALACGLGAEAFGRLSLRAGAAAADTAGYVGHVRAAALVSYPGKEDAP